MESITKNTVQSGATYQVTENFKDFCVQFFCEKLLVKNNTNFFNIK